MPERIIVPITTCKYNRPKKGEVVKIDETALDLRNKKTDKKFLMRNLGIEKATFTDFVVEIDNKADCDKLENFCHLIEKFHKCLNCGKIANIFKVYTNSDYELVIPCEHCLSNNIEAAPDVKDNCKWWDTFLQKGYGLTFKDGHPKAVRAQWGTKCLECGGLHDGGGIEFSFT